MFDNFSIDELLKFQIWQNSTDSLKSRILQFQALLNKDKLSQSQIEFNTRSLIEDYNFAYDLGNDLSQEDNGHISKTMDILYSLLIECGAFKDTLKK